jgi:hypothetical protein
MRKAITLSCGIAMFAIGSSRSLPAQIEVGTWVRQATASMPGMTMTIEVCCNGGRRLSYHLVSGTTVMDLTLESRLDGSEAEVMINGKRSGETMAITRVDAHHASNVLRLNGTRFATSQSTLSADGRTLTVITDYTSALGGQPVGRQIETWVRK